MTIYVILCGYTDFTNLADFLKVQENYFNELLDLKNGTPSHDTLSNVFSIIDSAKFLNIFIDWISKIIEQNGNRLKLLGELTFTELRMMLKKLSNTATY